MRSLIAATLAAIVATAAPMDYNKMFAEFKIQHGRRYSTEKEEAQRFETFVANMKKAEKLAAANPEATFGASPYADYTEAEFKSYHNGNAHFAAAQKDRKNVKTVEMSEEERKVANGEKIDWRQKGAVTPVKNQGQCGSCWSFSTTGGIEGQWFLAGNPLTSLSEQELVSCDTTDHGCQGGIMQNAFSWLLNNKDGKIVTAESYPYTSGMGNVPACDLSGKKFGAQINGQLNVQKTEDDMAAWVYKNGPLSIAVDATSWQTYTGGIMTNCQSTQVDHGVLIVGFDDANSTPYWIVKNSWGPTWGEEGYIRVKKGSDECLITYDPTSSTVGPATTLAPGQTEAPTTMAPPTPATTAAPAGKTFTQKICPSAGCKSGCQEHTFPQGQCLQLQGGGSAKATCSANGLTMTDYPLSSDCSGFSIPTTQPINQCVQDEQGSYLENLCSGQSKVSADAKFRKL
jgi:cysteine peptidase B